MSLILLIRCCLLYLVSLPAGAQVSVNDATGAAVTLAGPAQRIITLTPHAAELVYAAGAGDRIVGVSAYTDRPAGAEKLPQVGDAMRTDRERIVALRPDLVIAWASGSAQSEVAALKRLGFPVYLSNPADLDDVATELEAIAKLTGTTEEAGRAIKAYRGHLAYLRASYADRGHLRVLYLISPWPPFTVSPKHIISQALALCGGETVFPKLDMPAAQVSVESIIARRPEVMIFGLSRGHDMAQVRQDWAGIDAIPAVHNGHLYGIDADLLHRPVPRLLEGVEQLCDTLDHVRSDGNGSSSW